MKRLKIKTKAGTYSNGFKITPCIQVTYAPHFYAVSGFAIEFSWGKWAVGVRFYN